MGSPRALRMYVHVPYCAARCGYCDFNTYAPGESGGFDRATWRAGALAEVARARRVLAGDDRPVASVFVGGGTPTLLPPEHLADVLRAIRDEFGLAADAEITVEANPETITDRLLAGLLDAGVNRLSLGMQSADEAVLATLNRRHTPGGAVAAARAAMAAGVPRVSLDLIYGTPGETDDSWRRTLHAAVDTGVGHVSAYALKIEDGTAMARQVRRGDLPPVDDDTCARRYELAEAELAAAGLHWYEISNWARPGQACDHNLGYWRGDDWWGVGPGAHSHLAGRRWWNVKHPNAWLAALAAGVDPTAGAEDLTPGERVVEQVMLGIRLADGLPLAAVPGPRPDVHRVVATLAAEGLLRPDVDRVALTLAGRRLADGVTLRLLAAGDQAA